MDVRIATLNIYGYPSSFLGNSRDDADRAKIGELIKRLDADVIVFQEIVDLDDLERLLSGLVPGRNYRLKDDGGRWMASSAAGNGMKVVLAFDSERLKLLEAGKALKAGQAAATGGRRDSVAARLSPVEGGKTLTVIGVHLISGELTVSPTKKPRDIVRVEEVKNLIDWIESLSPVHPGGQPRTSDEPAVLIGDFNALRRNISVEPILSGQRLVSWTWPEPLFASTLSPLPLPANIPKEEQWTTYLDKEIIDHVLLSPKVDLVEGPWVYVFDHDASWLEAAGVTKEWLEKPEYVLTHEDGIEHKENLHRITDHRPVRVVVKLD